MGDRVSLVEKIAGMKKAGVPLLWAVLIGLVSTPGIMEKFFDDTDDRALSAIETAYPVLANEVDHQGKDLEQQIHTNRLLYDEIRSLRSRIDSMMATGMPFLGAGGDLSAMGPGVMPVADEEGMSELESESAPEIPPVQKRPRPKKAKKSLDDMMQQKAPARGKLPDLEDIMGRK